MHCQRGDRAYFLVAVGDRLGRWGRWKDAGVSQGERAGIPPLFLRVPPSPLVV